MSQSESIYELIPKVAIVPEKPPMHRSKYPGNCPPTASSFGRIPNGSIPSTNLDGEFEMPEHKQLAATWGSPLDGNKPDPKQYKKKKQSTNKQAATVNGYKFECKTARKPAVPKGDSLSSTAAAAKEPRNFVLENALNAMTMKSDKGAKEAAPNYLEKEDFGVVPDYLKRIQEDITAEKEQLRKLMSREQEEEARRQHQLRALSDSEKQELLVALKAKWDSINAQYQGMTHMTALDTITKIRRKEHFESHLAELEKSIDKLSKKVVFVRDD